MVRASISALGVDSGKSRVLWSVSKRPSFSSKWFTYSGDDLLGERSQGSVDVVSDDADNLPGTRLDIASHILVKHSLDITAFAEILLEDGTTAEQTRLLTSIPVELDSVLCLVRCDARVGKQDTESLKDSGRTRSIIICNILDWLHHTSKNTYQHQEHGPRHGLRG